MTFVNPYTFVGMPSVETKRSVPAGHARLATESFSGALELTWTARTPVLIGAVQGTRDDGPNQPPMTERGRVLIPGSLLHGAIRSVHETLAGGCLRVIDLDYAPNHRMSATPTAVEGVTLAMVDQVEDGRAITMKAAAEVAWISLDVFGTIRPRSGNRYTIKDPFFRERRHGQNERREIVGGSLAPAADDVDDAWHVLVTDTRARRARHGVYFAAAQLFPQVLAVPPGVWANFAEVSADADDTRPASLQGESLPVTHPSNRNQIIGYRDRVTGEVRAGQLLWVTTRRGERGDEVTEVRYAQLWRRRGRYTVGDRIYRDQYPCGSGRENKEALHSGALCPSCMVFGSAEVRFGDHVDLSEQHSYRGHVMIDDATSTSSVEVREFDIAPLRSPKPSAGQFYLDNSEVDPRHLRGERDAPPRAQWGSVADPSRDEARLIAGRKFYWRTKTPDSGSPRARRRRHQDADVTRLIPAQTTFRSQVVFDGLTLPQLGGLIAAVSPGLVLGGEREVVSSIGGGRPFGFGSIAVRVDLSGIHGATERYLGSDDEVRPDVTVATAVEAFTASVDDSIRSEVWPQLRSALTLGRIDDHAVWYPHGRGSRGDQSYDEGFMFWRKSSGVSTGGKDTLMVSLPRPDTPDQSLTVED